MNYSTRIDYWPLSPPCRAVLLTLKGLGSDTPLYHRDDDYLSYDMEELDVLNGEHLWELLDESPTRKVPFLWDGLQRPSIWESRAILLYLVNRHHRDVDLRPVSLQDQARVEQLLFFNNGTLYASWADYFLSQVYEGAPPDKSKLAKVEKALQVVDRVLEGRTHLVGDRFTIADFDYLACISSFEASDVDFLKYPNIKRWYEHVKSTARGYEQANGEGLAKFKEFTQSMLNDIIS